MLTDSQDVGRCVAPSRSLPQALKRDPFIVLLGTSETRALPNVNGVSALTLFTEASAESLVLAVEHA